MHLIYVDDSCGKPYQVFSGIAIPAEHWASTFRAVKNWRRKIKDSDGIFTTRELHATDFTAGRGRIAEGIVAKGRRCEIFREALAMLAGLPNVQLFNVCTKNRDYAFERFINRINRTMQSWASHAIIVSDEGNEEEYKRLMRRMSVHNPIPSQYGRWNASGDATKNIPTDRILDDPFFRESSQSYFVQLADFCAFALLRRELVLEHKLEYGLHTAFDQLDPICVKATNPKDRFGIIR